MTIAQRILLKLVRAYQKTLSPDHGIFFSHLYPHGCCKFHPTCSEYGYQSIKRFGALRGSWLSLRRVCRCNPVSQGGVDDVPLNLSKHQ